MGLRPPLFSSSIVSSLLCLSQKEWASDSISLELPIDLVSDSTEVYATVWGKLEILDQKEKRGQRLSRCGVRCVLWTYLFVFLKV